MGGINLKMAMAGNKTNTFSSGKISRKSTVSSKDIRNSKLHRVVLKES
jgi:hypothetical protein